MKLRNKKTDEIGEPRIVFEGKYIEICVDAENHIVHYYKTLHGMFKEWEVIKEHYFISEFGRVYCVEYVRMDRKRIGWLKEIGNWFDSKEEAEKAVEKLKAWKRLKDKGFKFEWWISKPEGNEIDFYLDEFEWCGQVTDDLNLLFGGKE